MFSGSFYYIVRCKLQHHNDVVLNVSLYHWFEQTEIALQIKEGDSKCTLYAININKSRGIAVSVQLTVI